MQVFVQREPIRCSGHFAANKYKYFMIACTKSPSTLRNHVLFERFFLTVSQIHFDQNFPKMQPTASQCFVTCDRRHKRCHGNTTAAVRREILGSNPGGRIRQAPDQSLQWLIPTTTLLSPISVPAVIAWLVCRLQITNCRTDNMSLRFYNYNIPPYILNAVDELFDK